MDRSASIRVAPEPCRSGVIEIRQLSRRTGETYTETLSLAVTGFKLEPTGGDESGPDRAGCGAERALSTSNHTCANRARLCAPTAPLPRRPSGGARDRRDLNADLYPQGSLTVRLRGRVGLGG